MMRKMNRMMRYLFYLLHKISMRNCKNCEHCRSRNLCDIHGGLWADYGYCSLFEKQKNFISKERTQVNAKEKR